MAKLPEPPVVEAIAAIEPAVKILAAGTTLARVYFTGGEHPARWSAFRRFGLTTARFDHHVVDRQGHASTHARAVLYCAATAATSFAEVFQETRIINRSRRAPWLVVFDLEREVRLLDLTGSFPTRIGASMAINTGQRARARRWAAAFYEAYPALSGIYYASSMHANAPAIALTDRVEVAGCLKQRQDFELARREMRTIDNQVASIIAKLGVKSRQAAAQAARERGVLPRRH